MALEVAALPLSPDGGHDLHQEDLKGSFNEEAAAQEEGLLLEAAEAAEAGLAAMEGDLASGDISAADGQADAKAEAAVGRVRAFVRPRPLPDDLLRSRGGNCIQSQRNVTQDAQDEVRVTDDTKREAKFVFDRVFDREITNSAVFIEVGQPLVDAVVSGYNGTLMAYGQTGTGKTYSMYGPDDVILNVRTATAQLT